MSPAPSQSSKTPPVKNIKRILDEFYNSFPFEETIPNDPIEFPSMYKKGADVEAAGFISSALSYGRVELFKPVIRRVLSPMGRSPSEFMAELDFKKKGRLFGEARYRFNGPEDIACLVFLTGRAIRRHGSLKKAFMSFFKHSDPDVGSALSGFMAYMRGMETSPVYGRNIKPPGLIQFFPMPSSGGASKRANMFLRWMVRDKDIDFGLWRDIPKNKLVIPLDTHIARVSRCLGLTARKTPKWKTALEITRSLKTLDPEDPVKYDFALCHHGISGVCPGGCEACALRPASFGRQNGLKLKGVIRKPVFPLY